jgi:hypothetical protein
MLWVVLSVWVVAVSGWALHTKSRTKLGRYVGSVFMFMSFVALSYLALVDHHHHHNLLSLLFGS